MGLVAYIGDKSTDNAGKPLYPHLHEDGKFVASHTRFKVDYIRVETEEQLQALVAAGYSARMSNPTLKAAPSLIINKNITMTDSYTLKDELTLAVSNTDLDVEVRSKRRVEQVLLRSFLLRGQRVGTCVLCGEALPENMIVAAHLKKRASCSDKEKMDFTNIASLMCKLGCDDMYEKGYVYVVGGKIVKNPKASTTPKLNEALLHIDGRKVSNWIDSRVYYEWHAKQWQRSLQYI